MESVSYRARLLTMTALGLVSSPLHAQDYGIHHTDPGPTTITNNGTLAGARTGIRTSGGAMTLNNSGTIRGNGNSGTLNTPDGGVIVSGAPADIANSGTISGLQFGISTSLFFNEVTGLSEIRATYSSVDNSGTIIGDNNDGVRLQGGGTVTNSGIIEGRVGSGADGVAIFPFTGQNTSGVTSVGAVTNLAGGSIFGNRFGVVLSGGGLSITVER